MKKQIMALMTLICVIAIGMEIGCAVADDSSGSDNKTVNNTCIGGSCNTTIIPPVDNCGVGEDPVPVAVDGDTDQMPDSNYTMTLCLGSTAEVPAGWTWRTHPPYDLDPCPGDHWNECGITTPSIMITAVVSGHTVTVTATPLYASGHTEEVRFFWGVVSENQWVDTNASGGWNYTWTNVAAGQHEVTAVMTTNDGKTATSNKVTVTIFDTGSNPTCVSTMRCLWATTNGVMYQAQSSGCYASLDGQDPNWQWSTFRSCSDYSNGCVIEDEVYATALNNGHCAFNIHAPEFLNGNPANPFGSSEGDFRNWACTPDGNGGAYNALAVGYPQCYLNVDCQSYVEIPVVYTCDPHGCNYYPDFTGSINTFGAPVNVFIKTYGDTDGDGYPNACQPGDSGCVADNCIRYANPDQTVNPCVTGPNPDVDNDWYPTGAGVPTAELDLYPTDRNRH